MNKRNKFIVKSIKKNLKTWIKFSLGKVNHIAGNRFIDSTEKEVLITLKKVYSDYKKFGNLDKNSIKEKKILEIGPGDSFGVALQFLFDGAKEVVCFDKFYANRNEKLLKSVYKKIISEQKKYVFSSLFDKNLHPKPPIKYDYGKGIEDVNLKNNTNFYKEKFDLIISNQVLQEIYNPKLAFDKMIELLAIGGKMVHHIDFEPYNYFRAHSKAAYDFLTYNEFIYKWMVNKRGMSNRKRISEYIKILDAHTNISYKFLVYSSFLNLKPLEKGVVEYPNFTDETKSFYQNIVDEQKKGFRNKYKKLPIEDFIVGNAYLIIEKNI